MKKSLFLIALMASITSFAQTHYALSTYDAAYTELINPAIVNYYVEDMDITGKEIMTGKIQNKNPINVSNLNAGVYLFSINGMSNSAKLIKQ